MKRLWLCGLLLLAGCEYTDPTGKDVVIGHKIPEIHIENKLVLPEHRHLLPWRNKPKPNPDQNGSL